MFVEFEIGFNSQDTLLVFGGLVGVFVGVVVSGLLLLTRRSFRLNFLYGLLLALMGGSFILRTVSKSVGLLVNTNDNPETVLAIDVVGGAALILCLITGAFLVQKSSRWLTAIFSVSVLLSFYQLAQSEYLVPVWIISFQLMLSFVLGILGIFLLRPERRSLFDG